MTGVLVENSIGNLTVFCKDLPSFFKLSKSATPKRLTKFPKLGKSL